MMIEFTDQGIGFMGIVSLCEALRMNTKITDFYLYSELLVFVSILCPRSYVVAFQMTKLDFDGAMALSKLLKTNTTLKTIALDSLKQSVCVTSRDDVTSEIRRSLNSH